MVSWRNPLRLVSVVLVLAIPGRTAPLAAADYSRYHSYEALASALRDLAQAHPSLARLVEVARTREGRTVWAIEIGSRTGVPPGERPGVLVAANFEANQAIGSEIALYTAESLLTGYATSPEIRQRLDALTIYVVPRVNVDGAERLFASIATGQRTNARPFDDDNDGRVDEDGPDDLNKDGVISVMRVKDPNGPYMLHPDDPRVLRRADPQKGDAGGYAVYWEGLDDDGDGFYNEDPLGGVDLNRNFQHQYPYYQPAAGPYMVSEPETRGLMEFVIQRRNIAAILTFGESDNLVMSPTRRGEHAPPQALDLVAFAEQSVSGARNVGRFPQMQGRGGPGDFFPGGPGGPAPAAGRGAAGGPRPTPPATTVHAADVEYFRTIGEKYREITGIRTTPATRTPAGAFFEYGYYQFGVPSFSTPGWGLAAPAAGSARAGTPVPPPGSAAGSFGAPGAANGGQRGGGPGSDGAPGGPAGDGAPGGSAAFDLRLVRWLDDAGVDGFLPWRPFTHPTLGAVEIGGFRPGAITNPPAAQIEALGRTHAAFVMYLSSLVPHIAIANTSVASLGGGLFRIKADVENRGFLPTALAQGVRSRAVKPTLVQLGVDPAAIVSGSAKTNFIPALDGSGRRHSYEWIVKGAPGSTITVKAVAQKGGTASAALVLRADR